MSPVFRVDGENRRCENAESVGVRNPSPQKGERRWPDSRRGHI